MTSIDDLDLKGKTVVVTGASRGLGAGMAQEMHRRGMKLGLCARSEPILGESDRVVARQFDITDAEALQTFLVAVEAKFGTVDLWINNAGVLEPIDQLRRVTAEAFRRHLEINVLGVFLGSRNYANHVRASGKRGVLINISSGAGRHAISGWSAYCASKAAVDRMTEVIALEEQGTGLEAYAVAPGIIDTAMQELIRSRDPKQFPDVERFRRFVEEDAFVTPEEVAQRILLLAFDPESKPDTVAIDLRG